MFSVEMLKIKDEINKKLEGYTLEVGVLADIPAKFAKKEQKPFHGGVANKKGKDSPVPLRAVLEKLDAIYNILLGPWGKRDNMEVALTVREMIADMNKTSADKQRFLNAAQAVVRNPILRGEYGDNSPQTQAVKGFNRLLINTGTLFENLKTRLAKKNV